MKRIICYVVIESYLWLVELKGLDLRDDFVKVYNYVFVEFGDRVIVGSYCDFFESVFIILKRKYVFK